MTIEQFNEFVKTHTVTSEGIWKRGKRIMGYFDFNELFNRYDVFVRSGGVCTCVNSHVDLIGYLNSL